MSGLIFAATCDLEGKVRGKALPAGQMDKRLKRGVGWTPTNVQITCFDGIADSPFGALGDLLLIPDQDRFGGRVSHPPNRTKAVIDAARRSPLFYHGGYIRAIDTAGRREVLRPVFKLN